MYKTRREFLTDIAAGGTSIAVSPLLFRGQQRRNPFPEPPGGDNKDPEGQDAQVEVRSAKKALALKNEREFREGVERLQQLAQELNDEVRGMSTSAILSVRVYKKTEEIEKLAKQLKVKAKGG